MSQQAPLDQIISASWVITMNESCQVLENHSVVIQAGRIKDICSSEAALKNYPQFAHTELLDQAILPGFINNHTHAAMSLFKGFADDMPLQEWLNKAIWPAEGKWIDQDFIRDGSELACAEMIKGGTTCFNDMYFFPDVVAQVANDCQLRACLSAPILEFPSAWAQNAEEYISKALALHDDFRLNPLITTAFGPHAPYTVEAETLKRIQTLAEELDINMQMHLHENQQEVEDYKNQHGQSPVKHYAELGLLSPRLQAVHMTQLEDDEIELLAQTGTSVIHCPESNLKLASGLCPVVRLQEAGINVVLGTDGSASNNDLNMIGEMRSAALVAKVVASDASAVPAQTALKMATINGAKALGLDKEIGSLETGKCADIISIDLSNIESQPVYDPISQIVYTANPGQVSNVWVNGRLLLNDGALTTINEKTLLMKTKLWQQKISS